MAARYRREGFLASSDPLPIECFHQLSAHITSVSVGQGKRGALLMNSIAFEQLYFEL
jgi:hypothetical protein